MKLMGILNVTPDSFSDGGRFNDPRNALKRIEEMRLAGADIIDIGAESTFGPEAQVTAEEEWERLEPVLKKVDLHKIFVSLDTTKAEVAEKGLRLGVSMINDVTSLRADPTMKKVLLRYTPYVCLMYSRNETAYATRTNYQYEDVIKTIAMFLKEKTDSLIQDGFPAKKIVIDPGLGFFLSSDPQVSWEVLERLSELKKLSFPILVGPSMKSFLGGEIQQRLPKSLEAARMAVKNGASILRVHHLAETKEALQKSPNLL
ncbi:MAG: dihydropteroate synthase [bacterium]|nr:dihydropteroate synthase [bacterium]